MPEEVLDRRAASSGARLDLLAILIGGVVGLSFLYASYGGRQTDFENLGLGGETTPYFASHDGHKIHCVARYDDIQKCIADARTHPVSKGVVLWIGNSQLHGINQMREGEETAAALAHRRLEPLGINLVSVSRGATNPEEHLVWFSYIHSVMPLRALVLPVVFISLRTSGVDSLTAPVLDDPESAGLLRKSAIGRKILEERVQWGDGDELGALDGTFQQRSEGLLVGWLKSHSRLWDLRFEARGNFFHLLRTFRNTVLGIEPGTKRAMIRGSYERNMAALAAILDQARESGIRVLVYVVPLRQDVEPPYFESEYSDFKVELEALVEQRGAVYEDLDALVPGQHWGSTRSTRLGDAPEIDFLHFQYPGHVLLAERVGEALERDGPGSVR